VGFHNRQVMALERAGKVPRERRDATARRIIRFFRPFRLQVGAVVVMIVVTSLLGLINPWLLGQLLDVAIPRRDFGLLNLFVGTMIAAPIVSGVIGVAQAYVSNLIGQGVMRDLRDALYRHLQGMPLRFFTETRTGEIQSRLSNDVGGIQQVVTDTASSTVANLATAISTIGFMFFLDWRFTLLSLGVLPVFAVLTYRVGKVRRRVATETQKSLADVSAITEETLSVSGILLSKTFGQQRAMIDRFGRETRRLAGLQVRQAMVGRWFFMIVGTVFSITPAFVYWLAGWLLIHGDTHVTLGEIVVFTTLQSRLFFPVGSLLNLQVEIQGALALFDRIFEYLDLPQTITDAPDAVPLDPQRMRGEVHFQHVSFQYPRTPLLAGHTSVTAALDGGATRSDGAVGRAGAEGAAGRGASGGDRAGGVDDAAGTDGAAGTGERPTVVRVDGAPAFDLEEAAFGLDDIDFTGRPGELIALVGPSGSGKTTTTYLIPRLYDADEGRVLIDGRDVREVTIESLGRTIGVVTQETYLFHTSIAENLRYGRPEATDEEMERAARAAAIHDRIMELPDGYATVVGERGYRLSGGEKQRIAIARVLLKDPRILILDEATSALDTVSERLIQSALERLMEGRTTVAIAHRLSTILRADQILVYDHGRIVERGTHAELVAAGGLYARLYHEQFEAGSPARPAEELTA
jgi:ATP-binding cassette subfamily B protein